MPPPKTIFVDRDFILATVARIAAEQRAEAEQLPMEWQRDREIPNARWVPRDLELLAGKNLTASERKRHQEALRDMEAEGLIILDTRHVRLTTEAERTELATDG